VKSGVRGRPLFQPKKWSCAGASVKSKPGSAFGPKGNRRGGNWPRSIRSTSFRTIPNPALRYWQGAWKLRAPCYGGLEEEQSARQQLHGQLQVEGSLQRDSEPADDLFARLALHRDRLESLAAFREKKSLAKDWRVLGIGIAFLAGWLAGRDELAAGLVLLLADLLVAGFLVYQRNDRIGLLEREIGGWEEPVQHWLGSIAFGEPLIAEFIRERARCHRNRDHPCQGR